MRPIVPITFGLFLPAAVGTAWLPAEWRVPTWTGLTVVYLLLCTWAAVWPSAGIWGKVHVGGHPDRAEVALTFDDGPDERSTPALLDLLKERGVAATFFQVGKHVRTHPDLARRCHADGHLLANHSDSHAWTNNLLPAFLLRRDLARCQETLVSVTGETPRFYRPPHGIVSHALHPAARALGLDVVGWQVRGIDQGSRPVEVVVQRVLEGVRPGGIVLLHDGWQEPDRICSITKGVLDGLAKRGLKTVRLDDLLDS